jgi:hypothetical protein
MTARTVAWPLAIAASAAAAAVFTFAAPDAPARPFVVLSFAILAPGLALVRLLRIEDPLVEVSAGITLGIALETLVAVAAVYGGFWSPRWILAGFICVAVGAAAADVQLRARTADTQ